MTMAFGRSNCRLKVECLQQADVSDHSDDYLENDKMKWGRPNYMDYCLTIFTLAKVR
jgi:hypothetical protein